MDRRDFLKKTAMSTLSFGLAGCSNNLRLAEKSKRPNILIIFDDQHRYSALGCSGNKVIKTPNIDKLAKEGLIFDNAFSCCPVCSPFRGQLHTGKYPHKNGVICNEYKLWPNQTTLPTALKNAGYYTGFIGKLHLGYGPYIKQKRLGYDYMAAYNCNHNNYKIKYHVNEKGPFQVKNWAPTDETDLAMQFIDKHLEKNADKPFFLALAWAPPHYGVPSYDYSLYPSEFKIYDPAKVDLPPNVPKDMEAFARKEIADYYGNVTALDSEMGRILEKLNDLGISDNTIVIFTSDHGDHLSSHGYLTPGNNRFFKKPISMCASKLTPYEESIHIPLIIRYPKQGLKNARTDSLISSVDIMPTLLGLCDIKIPEAVQGHDLSHIILGKKGFEKDSVYLQILGTGWPNKKKRVGFWRGVRTKRWVYARWYDNEHQPILFDCKNDPYEMNNLAGKKEYAKIQAKLEKRLQKWIKETDDPFDTGKRDKDKRMLMIGQEFTSKKHG